MTGEELERLLLQKEGESLKDNAMQGRSPVNGKRVIGKAVAKGGMLLKGRNPQNVRLSLHRLSSCRVIVRTRVERANDVDPTTRRRYPSANVERVRRVSQGGA